MNNSKVKELGLFLTYIFGLTLHCMGINLNIKERLSNINIMKGSSLTVMTLLTLTCMVFVTGTVLTTSTNAEASAPAPVTGVTKEVPNEESKPPQIILSVDEYEQLKKEKDVAQEKLGKLTTDYKALLEHTENVVNELKSVTSLAKSLKEEVITKDETIKDLEQKAQDLEVSLNQFKKKYAELEERNLRHIAKPKPAPVNNDALFDSIEEILQ